MPERPPLRVLFVEDREDDAVLIARELSRVYSVAWGRVETEAQLRAALRERWDIVTIDHALPTLNAPQALVVTQELAPTTPTILISGFLSNDVVDQAAAADAYFYKGRLAGLPRATERILAERSAFEQSITAYARSLEVSDRETAGHAERVTELTAAFARLLHCTEAEIVHIRRGALLHDYGKIGVSYAILHKAGPLDAAEWAAMRRHPSIAYEIFKDVEQLEKALVIPYCHHEHWDGSGYPRGLAGEAIPLFARIFAVVDIYDAITSDRSYHTAMTERGALAEIARVAGTILDPTLAACFIAWKREGRL